MRFVAVDMLQLDSLLGYSVEKDSRHWLDLTANRVRVVVTALYVQGTTAYCTALLFAPLKHMPPYSTVLRGT